MTRFFFAWTADTRSTIKVLFILYFVSGLESESESESEPESEPIRSPALGSESESEQPHHDSATKNLNIHHSRNVLLLLKGN